MNEAKLNSEDGDSNAGVLTSCEDKPDSLDHLVLAGASELVENGMGRFPVERIAIAGLALLVTFTSFRHLRKQ
jgi:hypothetical protein